MYDRGNWEQSIPFVTCDVYVAAFLYRVAVAEKGALSVNLKVESTVGHASMPPKESSIGILANAVAR